MLTSFANSKNGLTDKKKLSAEKLPSHWGKMATHWMGQPEGKFQSRCNTHATLLRKQECDKNNFRSCHGPNRLLKQHASETKTSEWQRCRGPMAWGTKIINREMNGSDHMSSLWILPLLHYKQARCHLWHCFSMPESRQKNGTESPLLLKGGKHRQKQWLHRQPFKSWGGSHWTRIWMPSGKSKKVGWESWCNELLRDPCNRAKGLHSSQAKYDSSNQKNMKKIEKNEIDT